MMAPTSCGVREVLIVLGPPVLEAEEVADEEAAPPAASVQAVRKSTKNRATAASFAKWGCNRLFTAESSFQSGEHRA
jgi:hypothetical protein